MNEPKILDGGAPSGPVESAWERRRSDYRIVSPANKRKRTVLVVGTGLAGASAASSLAELGYEVVSLCIQDSARRAHSIAAQGGINAAKNYANDGDSVHRLFHDTVKGGDFRAREANVHRLAEISLSIIDQCVAQGVPFARDYAGLLATRSFGGTQVSRTFYARGQTGQQLLLGAYQALMRQVDARRVHLLPRREMLDLVVVGGRARGVIARDLVTGEIERYPAHAVILATGGYGNAYYLSTNAVSSNGSAAWRCHKRGALFANPCFTQIHPTCIPVSGEHQSKLTLMSESLRNDGRVWVPSSPDETRPPGLIPEQDRDYYLERRYPSYGNLVPRDVASRAAKAVCDAGRGVGTTGQAVFLDLRDAIDRDGLAAILEKYGNLFEMYERITGEDPAATPMRIYPAVHYTMGGLWVDYDLMTTVPGLFAAGEANFSDHGANRLGASALMQGLADGYFILPYSIGNYLAGSALDEVSAGSPEFDEAAASARSRIGRLLAIHGERTPREFHRAIGKVLWDLVGMGRNEAGLRRAIEELERLGAELWQDLALTGSHEALNRSLELASRVADFAELGALMARDALHRDESCGGHFREEHQTADGEALRDDERFCHVAAWEHRGDGATPELHLEPLRFDSVALTQRSYA